MVGKTYRTYRLFLSIVLSLGLMAGVARAADKEWTDADFQEFGKAATEPLPVGTVITQQNWEKYKDYMPEYMRVIFQGDHFFKWPADGRMVVGPTIPYSIPKSFIAATAKYGGSASLVPAPEIAPGALTVSGYKGGLPFPDPQATKVLFLAFI